MLYEQLKEDNKKAILARDTIKKNILGIAITKCTLLISDKRAKGEEITDGDVLQIIQKLIKEVQEEADAFKSAGREEKYAELLKQVETLKSYLPKMLSEDEIKAEIAKLEDKTMPSIMKYFKMNFQGKVDMSLVSKIARSL